MSGTSSRCPHPTGYIRNKETSEYIPVCNKLSCPVCGKRRISKLLDDVAHGTQKIRDKGETLRFVTLTTSPKSDQTKMGWYLNRFRAILAKHGYTHIAYFWVLELTKTGLKHYHMLIDTYIPQDVLKRAWLSANEGTAWMADIRAVGLHSPAGYMVKYLTKTFNDNEGFQKGERRYGFSKFFQRAPKPEKIPGKYEYITATDYMNAMLEEGTWYEPDSKPSLSPKTKIGRHATVSEIIRISEVTYAWLQRTTSMDNASQRKNDKREGASSVFQEQQSL